MLVRSWARWARRRIWTPFLLEDAAAAAETAAAVAATAAVAADEIAFGVEFEVWPFQGTRVTLAAEVGVGVRVEVRVGAEGDLLGNMVAVVRRVKVFSRNIATLLWEGMRRREMER